MSDDKSMGQVLIVEDEPRIAESIARNLGREGYRTEIVSSYEDLSSILEDGDIPAIMILDRLLGTHDSIALIQKIRQKSATGGILVLSAINSANEKARALELGADDYLAKPFSITELLARVKALERRTQRASASGFLEFGNVLIDLIARTVNIDGRKITLPNKEFSILRVMMQSPGRVLSKIQIFEQVWEMNAECETNVVETAIASLRKKLNEGGATIEIRNMRNVGYWVEVSDL